MHPFDWDAYDENPQGKGNLNTKLSKMRLDISRLIGGSNIAYVEEGKSEAFNDSQDDDEDEAESNPEECGRNEELRRKIIARPSKEITEKEMQDIAANTRLREVYQYRDWYKDEDQDNYLVFYNGSDGYIEPGKQIFYNYGRRTSSYLLQ